MKKLTLIFFSLLCYKMLGKTTALQHYYDGLYPCSSEEGDRPQGSVYYFQYEEEGLQKISYGTGKNRNNEEGWCWMDIIRDAKQRIEGIQFWSCKGKKGLALNRELGFAKEVRTYNSDKNYESVFFDSKGKKIRNPLFP